MGVIWDYKGSNYWTKDLPAEEIILSFGDLDFISPTAVSSLGQGIMDTIAYWLPSYLQDLIYVSISYDGSSYELRIIQRTNVLGLAIITLTALAGYVIAFLLVSWGISAFIIKPATALLWGSTGGGGGGGIGDLFSNPIVMIVGIVGVAYIYTLFTQDKRTSRIGSKSRGVSLG